MSEDSNSRQPRLNGADPELDIFHTLWGWAQRLMRLRNGEDSVREAIEELIEESGDDVSLLENEERVLLSNILSLRDITVEDVMVPRADITALDINTPVSDLIKIINAEAHSRIPVYQETLDDAIGMVHIKDVMAARTIGEELELRNIMRDVLFVTPSMQVLELLLEMRVKRIHMALVVDEFGGVDGLATIEDLVEEIIGEIEDEHDQDEDPQLTVNSDDSIEADARASIEAFEKQVGKVLTAEEREEFDTL
ncbi:MAG: CBS domain-containing protein, partial [Rhodospirillales bacterium]|nr:CBS domain-containing protein [Rhodospirillales bacterium]